MTTTRHILARLIFCTLGAFAISTSAAAADRKTTNMILRAGLGAAGGAVVSEGDPMLTLGGAAAGGVLGHVLTDDRKHHNRSYRRHYKGPKHHYGGKHYHVSKSYRGHKKHHKKHRKHHRRHR